MNLPAPVDSLIDSCFVRRALACGAAVMASSLACFAAPTAAAPKAEASAVLNVSVDVASAVVYNRHLHGVNVNFTTRPYGTNTPWVREASEPLGFTMYRYPAGGHANWWNWETGTYHPEEVLAKRVPPARVKDNPAARARVNVERYHDGAITVKDFVDFTRSMGADPIWVANLYSGVPAESAAWVAHNREQGYLNTFWELGNEHYLGSMRDRYPTAADYMREAREHATAMRQADPSIRLGIVGTTHRFRSEHKDDPGGDGEWIEFSDDADWNQEVAKHDFYDAVIIHDYMVTNLELIDVTEDEAHRYIMARNPLWFPSLIRYFQRTFSPEVKLWVTEWNLNPFLDRFAKRNPGRVPAGLDPSKYWVEKTMTHALFVADWLLQAARYPDNIENSHVHVLVGPYIWGLFQLEHPEPRNLGQQWIKNPPYYAAMLFGEASQGATRYQFLNTESGPKMAGAITYKGHEVPQVAGGVFWRDDAVQAALLINKGGTPVTLSLDGVGGGAVATEIAETWADRPLARWGESKQTETNNFRQPVEFARRVATEGAVVLRPYSITKIAFGGEASRESKTSK